MTPPSTSGAKPRRGLVIHTALMCVRGCPRRMESLIKILLMLAVGHASPVLPPRHSAPPMWSFLIPRACSAPRRERGRGWDLRVPDSDDSRPGAFGARGAEDAPRHAARPPSPLRDHVRRRLLPTSGHPPRRDRRGRSSLAARNFVTTEVTPDSALAGGARPCARYRPTRGRSRTRRRNSARRPRVSIVIRAQRCRGACAHVRSSQRSRGHRRE